MNILATVSNGFSNEFCMTVYSTQLWSMAIF